MIGEFGSEDFSQFAITGLDTDDREDGFEIATKILIGEPRKLGQASQAGPPAAFIDVESEMAGCSGASPSRFACSVSDRLPGLAKCREDTRSVRHWGQSNRERDQRRFRTFTELPNQMSEAPVQVALPTSWAGWLVAGKPVGVVDKSSTLTATVKAMTEGCSRKRGE